MFGRNAIGHRALAALVALGSSTIPASADVLYVPEEYPTIQAAMDAAQEGDTVLIADGVYSGRGNTGLSFNGLGFLVRSRNGPERCFIDCGGTSLAFWFVADEPPTAIVDGLTIRNGGGGPGGAVFLHHDGQPTFRRCVFTDNTASAGGAILAENGSRLTLLGCLFSQNQAERGGAVLVQHLASAEIVNCTFVENTATQDGGAIWAGTFATVVVRSSTLVRNFAGGDGGVILARGGALKVRGSTLADNAAGGFGGALACWGPNVALATDSILWSNSAVAGLEIALLTDPKAGGAQLTLRYCDLQGGPAAIRVQPGSQLHLGAGNLDVDPLFVDAPGGDYHLSPASPVRDAGDPDYLPAKHELDIDGQPRLFPPRIDIGSDEFHPYRAVR